MKILLKAMVRSMVIVQHTSILLMVSWRTRIVALCPVVLAVDVSQKLAGTRVA